MIGYINFTISELQEELKREQETPMANISFQVNEKNSINLDNKMAQFFTIAYLIYSS